MFAPRCGAFASVSADGNPDTLSSFPPVKVTVLIVPSAPDESLNLYVFTGEPLAFQLAAGSMKVSATEPVPYVSVTSSAPPVVPGEALGSGSATGSLDWTLIVFFEAVC